MIKHSGLYAVLVAVVDRVRQACCRHRSMTFILEYSNTTTKTYFKCGVCGKRLREIQLTAEGRKLIGD